MREYVLIHEGANYAFTSYEALIAFVLERRLFGALSIYLLMNPQEGTGVLHVRYEEPAGA